jgi:hypothetical protein
MPLTKRLLYSFYAAAIGGAALGLVVVVLSADAVGLLPDSLVDVVFSWRFVVPLFALSFLLAPWLSRRLPIVRGHV